MLGRNFQRDEVVEYLDEAKRFFAFAAVVQRHIGPYESVVLAELQRNANALAGDRPVEVCCIGSPQVTLTSLSISGLILKSAGRSKLKFSAPSPRSNLVNAGHDN